MGSKAQAILCHLMPLEPLILVFFQENDHLNLRDLARGAFETQFSLLIHACRCLQGTRD
jgi:hypothetical protein